MHTRYCFSGFWIRKLPSKKPIATEHLQVNVQGPISLALAQKDVLGNEQLSTTTEHVLKSVISSSTHPFKESPKEEDEIVTSKPAQGIEKSKVSRQKSIFEDLVVSTSAISSTTISSSQVKVDNFQTEDYKILDLFPSENISQTQNARDNSDEIVSTQSTHER